jgi:Rrf2 family protein
VRELTEPAILALHALHLMMLKQPDASLHDVSRSSGFPIDRIRGVVEKLRQAGLVESLPGRGFTLAKAAGKITIEEIVRAIEEPKAPQAPCGGDYDACASRGSCILEPLCRNAARSVQETLRSFTLADLMGTRLDLPNCMDPKLKPEASRT